MQRHITTFLPSALITGLTFSGDASAIITRHDVADSEYVVDDSDYPALVDLFEPGDCIGTLIHQTYLLTVAHCAEDLRTSQSLQVNGISHGIDEVLLHPKWNGWLYDIALIRFEAPVEGVTPYGLYRASEELGQTMILVGRGVHATGLEGEPGATTDGLLRRATNVVTQTSAHWIEVYFDEPDTPAVTDLEGVGASGDSGGPAFIETDEGLVIAGLNSWGEGQGSIRVGQYGAWDYSTRVSQHIDWIEEYVGATDDGDTGSNDSGDTGEGTSGDTGSDSVDSGIPGPGMPHGSDDDTPISEDMDLSAGCGCATQDPLHFWPFMFVPIGLVLRHRTQRK